MHVHVQLRLDELPHLLPLTAPPLCIIFTTVFSRLPSIAGCLCNIVVGKVSHALHMPDPVKHSCECCTTAQQGLALTPKPAVEVKQKGPTLEGLLVQGCLCRMIKNESLLASYTHNH